MASNNILKARYLVADLIRERRTNKNMSQDTLAGLSGCSRSTIARIEAYAFSPNADQLYAILLALDIDFKIAGKKILT